jgi:hypothetical protein
VVEARINLQALEDKEDPLDHPDQKVLQVRLEAAVPPDEPEALGRQDHLDRQVPQVLPGHQETLTRQETEDQRIEMKGTVTHLDLISKRTSMPQSSLPSMELSRLSTFGWKKGTLIIRTAISRDSRKPLDA